MKEVGMLNGHIDSALTRQGHCDLLIVADAGFPCPDHVEVIDIALRDGVPTVLEVLEELNKVHSVEKIVMANETREHNPTHFKKASTAFGKAVEVEAIPHTEFKLLSHQAKTIIRTGDFTAWGNVMLVSGAGTRWKMERK